MPQFATGQPFLGSAPNLQASTMEMIQSRLLARDHDLSKLGSTAAAPQPFSINGRVLALLRGCRWPSLPCSRHLRLPVLCTEGSEKIVVTLHIPLVPTSESLRAPETQ